MPGPGKLATEEETQSGAVMNAVLYYCSTEYIRPDLSQANEKLQQRHQRPGASLMLLDTLRAQAKAVIARIRHTTVSENALRVVFRELNRGMKGQSEYALIFNEQHPLQIRVGLTHLANADDFEQVGNLCNEVTKTCSPVHIVIDENGAISAFIDIIISKAEQLNEPFLHRMLASLHEAAAEMFKPSDSTEDDPNPKQVMH